jgi:trigger factor
MSTETTVVVENAGPARKRLKITIPAKVVDAHIEEAYANARGEVQIPGFRRGTAPAALIEKRFGAAILEDVRRRVLTEAYQKAIADNKLQPISEPEVDEKGADLELRRGKPLAVTMDLEVVPEITLPNLEDVEVRRPMVEVEDKYVGDEIRRLGYRFGTPSRIEGPFQELDRMVGKAVVRVKGAAKDPYFESEECLVVVPDAEDEGKGQVLGLMFDDLAAKLKGRKVGESIALKTKGPDAHEREDLRGAEITVEFTPAQAERIAPAAAEGLAEQLGLGSVENLREQVKLQLEGRRDQEQRTAMREQAAEWLVDRVRFELPERMSGAQAARNLEMNRMRLMQQGLDEPTVERRLAELRAASEEDTHKRLRAFFILTRLAQELGVEVSEAELNAAIVQAARSRGTRPDQVRAELQQSGRLNEMALAIRESKVLDRVLAKAKVTDIAAEEWNRIVADKQKALAERSAPGKKG